MTKTELAPTGASVSFVEELYFTKGQLATALGRTVRTIDRLLLQGDGPPATRLGRTVLFRKDAVVEWLRSREKPARAVRRAAAPRGGVR